MPLQDCGRDQPGHGPSERAQGLPAAGAGGLPPRHPAVLPDDPQAAAGAALHPRCADPADLEWHNHQAVCSRLHQGRLTAEGTVWGRVWQFNLYNQGSAAQLQEALFASEYRRGRPRCAVLAATGCRPVMLEVMSSRLQLTLCRHPHAERLVGQAAAHHCGGRLRGRRGCCITINEFTLSVGVAASERMPELPSYCISCQAQSLMSCRTCVSFGVHRPSKADGKWHGHQID